MCAQKGFGMYILWPTQKACPRYFSINKCRDTQCVATHVSATCNRSTRVGSPNVSAICDRSMKQSNKCRDTQSFLANWYGNKELQYTKYVALTNYEWHLGYDATVRGNNQRIYSNKVAPYFNLIQLHFEKKGHSWDYRFVGQGARALAYSIPFAKHGLPWISERFIG